jgi:hypothetical protein
VTAPVWFRVGCIALLAAAAGALGWKLRDLQAAEEDKAALAAVAAETTRQADIHLKTENYLRDQMDRANTANAGVHLGSVRCSVSLRDPSGDMQSADGSAAGDSRSAADVDAAAGAAPDIGPELEAWAGGQLTAERERLRACQRWAIDISSKAVK